MATTNKPVSESASKETAKTDTKTAVKAATKPVKKAAKTKAVTKTATKPAKKTVKPIAAAKKSAVPKKATIAKEPKKAVEPEKTKTKGFFKSLFDNVAENVVEGASYVSGKVKETTAKAYVASAELVEEANEKIHQFTDKQSLNKEKHRIEDEQTKLVASFGALTLQQYLKTESLRKSFMDKKAVSDIVEAYKANQKHLASIEMAIHKLENQ